MILLRTAATFKLSDSTVSDNYEEKRKLKAMSRSTDSHLFASQFNAKEKAEKQLEKDAKFSNTSNSTLSLHIAAFENFVEAASPVSIKKWENKKQLFDALKFVIQNPFEFPRQENDKAFEPEVSQFRASQRLFDAREPIKKESVPLISTAPNHFRDTWKERLAEALEDTELYHSSLEHGADVEEVYLRRYGFHSLQAALEWADKPISYNFDHVKDRALEILIITEKDTMAREIARYLSDKFKIKYETVTDRRGDPKRIKHYHFTGEFYGKAANIWIVSTFGHLMNQTFPRKVGEIEVETMLYAKIIDVPDYNKKFMKEYFKQAGENCDLVLLMLDNDEEGEAIGFECIEYLFDVINVPPSGFRMDAFCRILFSAAPEVVNAVKNLTRPNFRSFLSMVAKHHLDLRCGVALSRCQGVIARHFLPTKCIPKLSFRPCGSICVNMIADRYEEALKAEKQFCLEFTVMVDGKEVVFSAGKYPKNEAEKLCDKIERNQYCKVANVTKSDPIIEESPPGLNSFELLKFLSRHLRIDSTAAAAIAQHLYQSGLISYPRSESTKHSGPLIVDSQQFYHNLSVCVSTNVLGFYETQTMATIKTMTSDVMKGMQKGEDKLDHPPITPTLKNLISYDGLNDQQYYRLYEDQRLDQTDRTVYNFIVRRYLAICADDYSYCNNTVAFKFGQHEFEYLYFTTENIGFVALLPELLKKGTVDGSISFDVGAKFDFTVKVKELPEPLLEEYELIQKMEDNHIGTDGSIPKHIEAIEHVGFVKIDEDTFMMEPEKLGTLMANAYRDCMPDAVNPKFRARYINDIHDVATGRKQFVPVYNKGLKDIDENFQRLCKTFYLYFDKNIEEFRGCFKDKHRR